MSLLPWRCHYGLAVALILHPCYLLGSSSCQPKMKKAQSTGFLNYVDQALLSTNFKKRRLLEITERKNWNSSYLGYHLSSCFVPLTMRGFLFQLLEYPLPGGSVLQGELRNDPTELVWLRQVDPVKRHPHPEAEFVIPVEDSSVDFDKDDYSFGAVSKEIGHPAGKKKMKTPKKTD